MWTDDALWLADQFKLDRTTRSEIEGIIALRTPKGVPVAVTEEDIWRFIGGKL
jgi:hypothetical protein